MTTFTHGGMLQSMSRPETRFEKLHLPVVLIGDQDDWQARHKWTLKRLGKKYETSFWSFSHSSKVQASAFQSRHRCGGAECDCEDEILFGIPGR